MPETKNSLYSQIFQVFGAGVGVGFLILEIVRAADGIMLTTCFSTVWQTLAVRAVLQIAVRGGIALKRQQCARRAVCKAALSAELVERPANKQMVAVVEQNRLTVLAGPRSPSAP